MRRIAIIGSGISGLGAAFALKDTAEITVFEAAERPGGHAHTVDIDYNDTRLSVDVGFIVYNGQNYPNLSGLFEALDVDTAPSDMSFAVSNPDGYEWASTVRGLFADPLNLFRPRFHRFWRTILKFNDLARAELSAGTIGSESLGFWLDKHGFERDFLENYVLPMGAAIWSTPEQDILQYPAKSFFQFFENHRLMHRERPQWRTVSGGSRNYVEKLIAKLSGRVRLSSPVTRIAPFGDKVHVVGADGTDAVFDDVIIATHSDSAHDLLDPYYESTRFLLRSIHYRPNEIYLHKDPAFMPTRRAAWASWNVLRRQGPDICLTYWMNRLQNLPRAFPVFVTLNPETPPAPENVFAKHSKSHPQFDGPTEAAVRALKQQQGRDHIWLAGAWMGSGFHEDGLKSGLSCALALGGRVPWNTDTVEIARPDVDAMTEQMVKLGVIQ